MGYKSVILEGAQEDLEGIVAYLHALTGGSSAALEFIEEFNRQTELVCENPELYGLSRMPELSALGYRTAFVKSYVMLYFVRNDTVVIAHLFHQRQDYARLVIEHKGAK